MLVSLCLLADFRAGAVRITYWELAEYTGDSRSTVPKTLAELEEAGLVKITRPFGQNREGEVVILAWEQVVYETPLERAARLRGLANNRDRIADESRTNRGPNADNSANEQRKQPFHRGDEGEGEWGGRDSCTGGSAPEDCRQGKGLSGESAGFDFGEANSAVSGSQEDASGTVCVDCKKKGHASQADSGCEHFEETW
jgi:DNA-binding transcriptional ArsR family regulator